MNEDGPRKKHERSSDTSGLIRVVPLRQCTFHPSTASTGSKKRKEIQHRIGQSESRPDTLRFSIVRVWRFCCTTSLRFDSVGPEEVDPSRVYPSIHHHQQQHEFAFGRPRHSFLSRVSTSLESPSSSSPSPSAGEYAQPTQSTPQPTQQKRKCDKIRPNAKKLRV